MGAPGDLTLRGVRVVDARGVRAEGADVRIEAGRIASIGVPAADAVPTGAVLDLAGRTVTPGLIDPMLAITTRYVLPLSGTLSVKLVAPLVWPG